MKPTPKGWPRMSSAVFYEAPKDAIEFLSKAFDFEVQLVVEGDAGDVVHSELRYGDGMVMVGGARSRSESGDPWRRLCASPTSVGGKNTQQLCFFVDDADAHCARARANGARIVREPATEDYGDDFWADRTYGALDPEGHLWFFMQRVRSPGEPRKDAP
ncbi:MAG: VOC family protein [Myxococcales bacterium]|nr:VOC family protein [Myxococcales bacterium]